jgi:hypothetical protein
MMITYLLICRESLAPIFLVKEDHLPKCPEHIVERVSGSAAADLRR